MEDEGKLFLQWKTKVNYSLRGGDVLPERQKVVEINLTLGKYELVKFPSFNNWFSFEKDLSAAGGPGYGGE